MNYADLLSQTLLERIAVFRALPGLGDFLCITPALRALRSALPQAKITLIGLSPTQKLSDRYGHYIDEFVAFPGYPGLPEQVVDCDRLNDFLSEMQSRQFHLAIQMHGSGVITNRLIQQFAAQKTAGFFLPGHECLDATTFLPYKDTDSEIKRYLQLIEFLGMPTQSEALEFPLLPEDWQALQSLSQMNPINKGYVCLHPGASVASRRWALENFVAIGDAIANMGWQVVLTGSAAEAELTQMIAQQMQAPSLNLAGQTSLGTLAALLSQAKLLVCNDTGVSHLAAALQTPSVVVFTGSDPQRWAPLDRSRHRSIYNPAGISVAAVLAPIKDLLEESTYVTR